MNETPEHILILKSFDELNFNLGRTTLVDFLKGDLNPTIEKNHLDELNSYGCLYKLETNIIFSLLNQLQKADLITTQNILGGFQVMKRTQKGLKEIIERKFEAKLEVQQRNIRFQKQNLQLISNPTVITQKDKTLFRSFEFFLGKYNDEQKKAIISPEKKILCVAGAGSGKTTVLTKRIEFLTKFRGVQKEKILAITFTKKAKEEMQTRLLNLGIDNVRVETFNSFSEKNLRQYGSYLYKERPAKVIEFKDKIAITRNALKELGIHFEMIVNNYFNKRQLREKSQDELFFIFMNDIFSIMDYYKNKETKIQEFYEREKNFTNKQVATKVYKITQFIEKELKRKNLRDFSDQILHTIQLFEENKDLIPKFEHVLVDEFQDVNMPQVKLIKLLKAQNLFAVGDPRQAIYGWRGSQIKYIAEFPKIFGESQIINLKYNYRSNKKIVDVFNKVIEPFGLIDLQAGNNSEISKQEGVFLIEHSTEQQERLFVIEAIKSTKTPRNQIFILARTNRVLTQMGDELKKSRIPFTIKSEEEYKQGEPKEEEVVLATVHSIKGMEAKEVFVIGATTLSFPNKVVDNFVFALVKEDDDYDKNSEELRLFYVALSRAESKLVINYTGNYSKFITDEMLNLLEYKPKNKSLSAFGSKTVDNNLNSSNNTVLKNKLKQWRMEKATDKGGIPAYMVISNNAIDDLVIRRPKLKSELVFVNGLGETKIAQYGEELIKLINS